MKDKLPKVWLVLILVNTFISLCSLLGMGYLLTRNDNRDNQPSPTPTTTATPTIPLPTAYNDKVDYKFTLENLPKIDGSTSNVPLRSMIICKILNYKCSWQEFEEGATKERYMDIKTTEANLATIKQKSVNSTTHNAYVKLINGQTDLIFVATLPSQEEQALMQEKNAELNIVPIAMDAFVFLVNKDNPVNDITTKQVLDVYTGKTTSWKDFTGGSDSKLNAYQREDNSGSQELMRTLILGETKPIAAPEMVVAGMIGLINRISTDKQGLGYSVYYYEQFMVQNKYLKLLGVNGVYPSYNSLSDRSYPLTAPVYMVSRKDLDKNSAAYNLAQWMLTQEGQSVVKDSGYVPIVNK